MDMKRRGMECVLEPSILYRGPVSISNEKKKDLLSQLPFVTPVFHDFYKSLPSANDVRNTLPDSNVSSEDEEA